MERKVVQNYLAKNHHRLRSEPEAVLAESLQLCHGSAGIPVEKIPGLIEIEGTSIALAEIKKLEARGGVPIEKFISLLERHRREAKNVYAAIGKHKWFDELHQLKSTGEARFFTGVDGTLSLARRLLQDHTHESEIHPAVYEWIRKFNQWALALHLGEEHSKRYSNELKSLETHWRAITGHSLH